MRPMLATRGDHVPTGQAWTHEVKWDGMRVLADTAGGRTRLASRNENDVSVSFPELADLAAAAPGVLLDGEVVALDDAGVPTFGALGERMHVRDARRAQVLAGTRPVSLIVFDLLREGTEDLTGRPLRERRDRLLALGLTGPAWQVPPSYDDGAALLAAAEQNRLEGIVSKRWSSAYHPGRRSREWLKFPLRPTGTFVVGGLRREVGSDTRLGAVLVGERTPAGLVYRGRVGSGIAGRAGQRLGEVLAPLVVPASPFSGDVPRVDREGTSWVVPSVQVDVQYLVITAEGRLRQPAYRGVRLDLD